MEDSQEEEDQVVDRMEKKVEGSQEAGGQVVDRMEREVEDSQEAEGQMLNRMERGVEGSQEANLLQAKLVPTDPNLVAIKKQAKAKGQEESQVTIR